MACGHTPPAQPEGRPTAMTTPPLPVAPPTVVPDSSRPDVVLVGGGIMSATLAALLNVVAPHWSITVFEAAERFVAGHLEEHLATLDLLVVATEDRG